MRVSRSRGPGLDEAWVSLAAGSRANALDEFLGWLQGQGLPESGVARLVWFLPGDSRYEAMVEDTRRLVEDRWPGPPPPSGVVLQPPASGGVCLEATVVCGGAVVRREGPNLALVTYPGGVERAMVTGVWTKVSGRGRAGWRRGLMEAFGALSGVGFGLQHVVRTWLYAPEILGYEGGHQRYQLMNEARAEVFGGVEFFSGLPGSRRGYPASTGIGAAPGPFVVDVDAWRGPGVVARPVENPEQRAAFHYPDEVLVGDGARSRPMFSRALVLETPLAERVYVSGTASIRGARTLHVGDPVAQTELTLDNIEVLVSDQNLQEQLGTPGWRLRELGAFRVYVKEEAHVDQVSRVCERRLGLRPPVVVVTDVCRDDLLVEIEAAGLRAKG